MANSVKSTLDRLFTSYKRWIVANPQLLSDIETTVKCFSYFSVGHFNDSSLASEMIYSIPNLIMLFNDMLIYRNNYIHPKIPQYESKLKIWLTALEYTQTLLEVSGKKLGGEMGRWLMIAVVQLFKTILRLLLIHIYKERVTKNPPVPPLNREKFDKITDNLQFKDGFRLKRSGIVVRNIKYADPVEIRTWKALSSGTDENQNLTKYQESDKSLKLAETIYVIKPLFYLGCASVTSQQHWQPWMLSLLLDVISLHMYARCAQNTVFNKEERLELARRKISLLLYILRSPFYEKCSRARINSLLDKISITVPLSRLLTSSLKKQLSYIQSVYFYTW